MPRSPRPRRRPARSRARPSASSLPLSRASSRRALPRPLPPQLQPRPPSPPWPPSPSPSPPRAREHRRRRHRRQPHPAAAAPPRTSSSLAAASSAAGGTGVTSSAGAASAMRTARVLAKDEWSWDKHHLQALFTNDLQTIYKRGPFTNEPVTLVILANKQTNQTNEASFVNSVCEHITKAEPWYPPSETAIQNCCTGESGADGREALLLSHARDVPRPRCVPWTARRPGCDCALALIRNRRRFNSARCRRVFLRERPRRTRASWLGCRARLRRAVRVRRARLAVALETIGDPVPDCSGP